MAPGCGAIFFLQPKRTQVRLTRSSSCEYKRLTVPRASSLRAELRYLGNAWHVRFGERIQPIDATSLIWHVGKVSMEGHP
jgi:hypothetical protein